MVLIHRCDAGFGVIAGGVHVIEIKRLPDGMGFGVINHRTAGDRRVHRDPNILEYPSWPNVIADPARAGFPVLRRQAILPYPRGFDDVIIDGYQPVITHLRCSIAISDASTPSGRREIIYMFISDCDRVNSGADHPLLARQSRLSERAAPSARPANQRPQAGLASHYRSLGRGCPGRLRGSAVTVGDTGNDECAGGCHAFRGLSA